MAHGGSLLAPVAGTGGLSERAQILGEPFQAADDVEVVAPIQSPAHGQGLLIQFTGLGMVPQGAQVLGEAVEADPDVGVIIR